jgi:hypothetical protein
MSIFSSCRNLALEGNTKLENVHLLHPVIIAPIFLRLGKGQSLKIATILWACPDNVIVVHLQSNVTMPQSADSLSAVLNVGMCILKIQSIRVEHRLPLLDSDFECLLARQGLVKLLTQDLCFSQDRLKLREQRKGQRPSAGGLVDRQRRCFFGQYQPLLHLVQVNLEFFEMLGNGFK